MTDGLKAPDESLPRGFVLVNTIAALLIQAAYVFVVTLPWSLIALWRVIRHGTPERSIKQMERAVLEALARIIHKEWSGV
jgi:hypothetical protein